MERWVGKVAVVTGANAGIGAAIVAALVSEGLVVAGFDRRIERIEELAKKLEAPKAKGKLHAVKVDMTKENEIIDGFNWVKKNLGSIHVLVNNAGVGRYGELIDSDTQMWKDIFDTNVIGLSIATREAVKDMRANNVDGHIIHINSIVGHQVLNFPSANAYPASKFAVTALSETLRHEFIQNKLKIKITSLSPGYVKTEFAEAGGLVIEPDSPFLKAEGLNAEDIANSVLYVLGTPPHVQIQELTIRPVGDQY
ncbi:farnesol dehydrogenase-like [Agrilus planipennis]|uniref:Farnesol dehydrogenase-like n=1 Tax=Agrilus planipennis TaxID=224129 RepID=A0A7F5RNW7_AGRPL|nr:farnesol dehydrogenase-like [Agrilus planipennis]